MHIDIAGDPATATTFAEECLIRLARCGVVATRVSGGTALELPDCAGPTLRVDLAAESNGDGAITRMSALLDRLGALGAIPPSGAREEKLLMRRLVDLGYL
jgi:hypothetical protein